MKVFISFFKKEILESVRTYRLFIMLAAFILFGIISPLLAKMIPDLVNGSDLGNGMVLQMPEPTAMDAWGQFFKNIGQLGVLVLVIVFCGIMAAELNKGTLVNVLTKGMRRSTVVISKFTVAAIIWTISYVLSLAVTYGYIIYYWGNAKISNGLLAFAGPWIFGILLISVLIFGGICFKNILGSLLSAAGVIIVLSLINIAPKVQKYNPISLSGNSVSLLNGQSVPGDMIPALVICLAVICVLVAGSWVVFNRRQI